MTRNTQSATPQPQSRRIAISPPRVRSVSDQVTESLRSMILAGDLRSGDQVTQEKLAEDLGVSTMPVREALLRLAHEGFIQGGRGRSFRVAPTTREDIQDIYWVHAVLAGELCARACDRMSAEDLEQLARIHERWLAAVAAGHVSSLERENFAFHRLINRAADSPKLLMLLRNTLRLIPEHFYSLLQDWATTSTKDHERILRALRRRDADGVRRASSNHIQQAGKMLIEYFDERGFWNNPNGGP